MTKISHQAGSGHFTLGNIVAVKIASHHLVALCRQVSGRCGFYCQKIRAWNGLNAVFTLY